MLTRNVRVVGLGFALMMLLVAGASAVRSGPTPHVDATDAKDNKLKALLKERHATLKEVGAQTAKEYQDGKASLIQMLEANRAVRDAELELCDTEKERVALLEKALTAAVAWETDAAKLDKAGLVSHTDALKVTADRLHVEIALERANAALARQKLMGE